MNIGFFSAATDVLLEAEVKPESKAQFEAEYHALTGQMPTEGAHFQPQPNKWGAELRVYFNCEVDLSDEFADLGISVEEGARPYRSRWRYRINNNEFFWALVTAGYRLGPN
ncbi:hypothetical protein ACW7G2_10360 [Luteimonas sp. A277]